MAISNSFGLSSPEFTKISPQITGAEDALCKCHCPRGLLGDLTHNLWRDYQGHKDGLDSRKRCAVQFIMKIRRFSFGKAKTKNNALRVSRKAWSNFPFHCVQNSAIVDSTIPFTFTPPPSNQRRTPLCVVRDATVAPRLG